MRHFLFYILFLLSGLPALSQDLSSWWYPMGNPGGTRQNTAPTDTQRLEDLVIKWRTSELRNSTILVGAVHQRDGINAQQVVGLTDDSLIILSYFGLGRIHFGYDDYFANQFTVTLTGLFNGDARSLVTAGRPNFIGIGIERAPSRSSDSLWGFLADSNGNAVRKIAIDTFPEATAPNNKVAGIYPVAAYRARDGEPVALAVVTQDRFQPAQLGDLPVNSLRRYGLVNLENNFRSARLYNRYPVAPRAYPQHPALAFDDPSFGTQPELVRFFTALSTATYGFAPPVTVSPSPAAPLRGVPTRSNEIYSIDIIDSLDELTHINTWKIPQGEEKPQGEAHSYITTLIDSSLFSGVNYRIITENHDGVRQGTPRIMLALAYGGDTASYGSYVEADTQNVGWRIVTGDLDGSELNSYRNGQYPNNTGLEVAAAWSSNDGADIRNNKLIIFRRNAFDTNGVGGPIPFKAFAARRFDGRLMAAGDLLSDPFQRQELVLANDRTVTIIQMRKYDNTFGGPSNNFFETLKSFTLDSRVVSVAIADLEGDGRNDLLVCTETATYAIGMRQAETFGIFSADSVSYCRGESVRVRWERKIGGGEEGVRVILQSQGGDQVLDTGRISRPAPDSIEIRTAGLQAGTYRLRIEDRILPSAGDTSLPFTITQPEITALEVVPRDYLFGGQVVLSGSLSCIDGVLLERSYDGITWEPLRDGTIEIDRDSVTVRAPLECPPGAECSLEDSLTIYYKVVDPDGIATPRTVQLRQPFPRRAVSVTPGDTSRSRLRQVRWNPADFSCSQLAVQISSDGGASWRGLDVAATASGVYSLDVPDDLDGSLQLRLCCQGEGCEYALLEFETNQAPDANYVAPNPFNPGGSSPGAGDGAMIVYRLSSPGTVTITIYDGSRAVTRRLLDGRDRDARRYRENWDGRNSRGEIVANGAYICVIESSSGEKIVLPIYVMKR